MQLISSAFAHGDVMPNRYTCEGVNISPPLGWTEVPSPTKSFAIVMVDPDQGFEPWYHWAIWNIPPTLQGIEEDYSVLGPCPQGMNDFHKEGWNGPCPPLGHGTHRHRFSLFALQVDRLPVHPGAHCRDVMKAAEGYKIVKAELVVGYRRG